VIAFDTNIIFAAIESTAAGHEQARALLNEHQDNSDLVLCELSLLELYTLLRNPKICRTPLSAADAVGAIQTLRHHPVWRLVDYSDKVANDLWRIAADADFPYRRIYDVRLALTLRHYGITEFATRNVKDFQDFGIKKVWDPLA
jgi:toxin-antitoxin system PIN domain toxin